MDVVYVVRAGEQNDELRWSLRSLRHLPHRNVVIAGHKPLWVTGVLHLPVVQTTNKHVSVRANLRAACSHPDVSDTFWLFNDDFFVTEPVLHLPAYHRGPIGPLVQRHFRGKGIYHRKMRATAEHVGPEALCWDALHTPMPIRKGPMLEVLNGLPADVLHRTAYGAHVGLRGVKGVNVKVTGSGGIRKPLCSTNDRSFKEGPVGEQVRALLPDPSPHEAPVEAAPPSARPLGRHRSHVKAA